MKKVLRSSMITLLVLFLSAGLCLAGNGNGQGQGGGQGAGDGSGPIHDIYAGDAFTVTGDVATIVTGQGFELDTGDEIITIYGLGPIRYWESAGVDRPAVGDTITVVYYEVDYDTDVVRNIAVSIEVGGVTVDLRDETGLPLWRQYGGQGRNQQ